MTESELKPCPLCGGEAELEVTVCDSVIRCQQCSCRISLRNPREGDCRDEARAAWNKRDLRPDALRSEALKAIARDRNFSNAFVGETYRLMLDAEAGRAALTETDHAD